MQETLEISVIPTFATNFLAQRIGCFQIDNPSIAVRIEVNQALADFASDGFDLAIRSGKGNWPGLKSHLLVPVVTLPLGPTLNGIYHIRDRLPLDSWDREAEWSAAALAWWLACRSSGCPRRRWGMRLIRASPGSLRKNSRFMSVSIKPGVHALMVSCGWLRASCSV